MEYTINYSLFIINFIRLSSPSNSVCNVKHTAPFILRRRIVWKNGVKKNGGCRRYRKSSPWLVLLAEAILDTLLEHFFELRDC